MHEFWQLFGELAQGLWQQLAGSTAPGPASRAPADAKARLAAQLARVGAGLGFELALVGAKPELIVTAGGDRELFPLARELVANAPVMPDWVIHALRPKQGFPRTALGGALNLHLSDLFFEPLERELSDDLGLRILVRGLDERRVHDAYGAVMNALERGLGEEQLAVAIQYTEVRALQRDAALERYMPLQHLETFIPWRLAKLRQLLN